MRTLPGWDTRHKRGGFEKLERRLSESQHDSYERRLAADIDEVETEIEYVRGPERIRIFIQTVFLGIILAALALLRQAFAPAWPTASLDQTTIYVYILLILVFLVSSRLVLLRYRESLLAAELSSLKKRQVATLELSLSTSTQLRPESGADTQPVHQSYFETLVTINVNNLAEYYLLVKLHTDKSFLICVAAGVIGFLLIASGLLFFALTDRPNSQSIAYLSSGAGIITEFIGGVFFYLYNRTVRQMKTYHDSLLAVQNILLSFKLLEDTQPGVDKAAIMSQMVTYLVGGRPNGHMASPVLIESGTSAIEPRPSHDGLRPT